MKKSLLFIIMFVSLHLWSQTKGKVTYLVSLDKTELEAPYENPDNSEAKNKALNILNEAQPVEAYLIFNDSVASYYVQDKDAPMFENNDGAISITPTGINFTWIRAGGERYFYTDWSRDYNISTFDLIGKKKRLIAQDIDWMITEEEKKINGYLCIKAVDSSNEKRIAWFTKDIPVKHGPRNINGLPGLILEFYDNKFSYIAQSVELNHKGVAEIKEPMEGDLITQEELKKLSGNPFGKD
ncbi:GLPGLI family protein [uncultured Winogradskyella sp.]|uniref:GLPGLI family protein n=1 Tax=uncultured Winogradskyella sp. TaxID=395353 RepID=UPI002606598A|nr:GLPGLI family protein [uncultured Winogradskyella sp.]